MALRRLAGRAPAAVFAVRGWRAAAAVQRLGLDPRVELVESPRHATILLVAGAIPADHATALVRLHDQLPHPRAAVWWTGASLGPTARQALPSAVEVRHEPAGAVHDLHGALMRDERPSSATLGPADNPTDWRGVGPHGQGGEGMMGGVPYGRRMPMAGDDVRDGLRLDRVPLTLGPYHAALPAGLELDLELQGDVVVACDARGAGAPWLGTTPLVPGHDPPDSRLVWLADMLRVHGLGGWGERVARAAAADPTPAGRARLVARSRRLLTPALAGVAGIDGEDALARLDRHLDPAVPRPARSPSVLAEHLPGLEWSAAVTAVWTLGIDPLRARSPSPGEAAA